MTEEQTNEIAVIEAAERGISPQRQIEQMSELVQAIAGKCVGPQFIANIQGKQYPKVEWWTTVGATQGLSASEVYSKRITCVEHDGAHWGYEAKAEVYDNTGKLRSSASMVCMSCEIRSHRTGATWGQAGEYAVKSMAYTRAVSKSYRVNLSYLAVMAKLQPTSAEEVPDGGFGDAPQDQGLGICPIHQVPFRQSEKQRAAGFAPSHKDGNSWCQKESLEPELPDIPNGRFDAPEGSSEAEAKRLLSERFHGEKGPTKKYAKEVLGRDIAWKDMRNPDWDKLYEALVNDQLDDSDAPKVAEAAGDDFITVVPDEPTQGRMA